MATFTRGERQIAKEEDIKAPWSGGKDGIYFRCGLCGHKFVKGDGWRWLYTNDIPTAGGNPLVCDNCYTDREDTRKRWVEMHDEFKKFKDKFWHFIKYI